MTYIGPVIPNKAKLLGALIAALAAYRLSLWFWLAALQREYQEEFQELYGESLRAMADSSSLKPCVVPEEFGPED